MGHLRQLHKHPVARLIVTVTLVQGLLALTGPLAVRLVGVAGRGELALVIAVLVMASMLAVGGVPAATVYFTNQFQVPALVVWASVRSRLLISVSVFAVAAVVLLVFLSRVSQPLSQPLVELLLLPVGTCIVFGAQLGLAGLQAEHRFTALTRIQFLQAVLYAGLLTILLAVSAGDVVWLLLAFLCTWLWVVTASVVILVRKPAMTAVHQRRLPRADVLGFAKRAMVASIAPTDQLRVDQVLIAMLLGHEALGLYVIGFAFETATVMPSTALGQYLGPRVASTPRDHQRRTALKWVGVAFLFTTAVAVVMQPFIAPVTRLAFGESSMDAVPLARLLVFAGIFLGLRRLLGMALAAMGHPTQTGAAETTAFVVMVAGVLVGASAWGVEGSCLGLLLGGITGTLIQLGVLLRLRLDDGGEST